MYLSSAPMAELSAAMFALEMANSKGWNCFWLETDSKLVELVFSNTSLVPWSLRNRWLNCFTLTHSMNFLVTHIFREGNFCADSLANIGLSLSLFRFVTF